jgi:DNA-binding NtrC family response regulator
MTETDTVSAPEFNQAIDQREYHDILLIDDEADILLIVGDLLRLKGLDVITALDAHRAMQQLDAYKVGLIVLDVNLAGEDGLGLLEFIKMNQPKVPVILYTGLSHDDKQVSNMLEQGAACYVNKVQSPAALIFAVEQVIKIPPRLSNQGN